MPKTGISFTWEGAWEYDPMSGSGRVTLGKDGRIKGSLRIKNGDSSTFAAVRAEQIELQLRVSLPRTHEPRLRSGPKGTPAKNLLVADATVQMHVARLSGCAPWLAPLQS